MNSSKESYSSRKAGLQHGIWDKFLSNEVLISAIVGWTVAQILKTLIDFGLNKALRRNALGPPAACRSHFATVCGLTTASALCYGGGFVPVCHQLPSGRGGYVRCHRCPSGTGKQAKLLNLIMEQDWFNLKQPGDPETVKGVCGAYTASGSLQARRWASFWHLWCTRVIYKVHENELTGKIGYAIIFRYELTQDPVFWILQPQTWFTVSRIFFRRKST